LYREVATLIVDTGKQSLRSLAQQIEQCLREHFESAARPPRQRLTQRGRPADPGSGYGPNVMHTVQVALADRSYPIYIGAGLLARGKLLAQHLPQNRVALITDTTVAALYLDSAAEALGAAGISVTKVVVPTGEQHKDWHNLNAVFDTLLANHANAKQRWLRSAAA